MKISSENDLSTFFRKVINESLKSRLTTQALREKDNQSSFSGKLPEGDPAPSTEPTASGSDKEQLQSGDVTVDDIIDKLNSIRSGKSFRDDSIKNNMEKYVNDLTKPEKTALLAFLKGISQIVTGEIQAAAALEPEDSPAGVSMDKKDVSSNVRHIKPNVIKKSSTNDVDGVKKTGKEDASGPVPIKPRK